MSQAEVAAILRLPFEERFHLFELLWKSLSSKPDEVPLSDEHRRLLDQEVAEYESNPDDVLTHEEDFAERRSLLDLAGKIELAPGYDHKALRGA